MRECVPLIKDPFVFPRRIQNRPGLETIDYRIGTYADFVEFLMRQINNSVELESWTHCDADDPGIALLQGAAILADILAFYQDRYANEAFLRTARWPESIMALTRLLGYRLAPGIGGRATFAFEVRGASPVVVPEGFPVKSDLADVATPADFHSVRALTAYPHLSNFHFYRSRLYSSWLPAHSARVELGHVDGSSAASAVDALDLKKGDRLLLLPAEPYWSTSGTSISTEQRVPQIVKVKAVTRTLGRTLVDLETNLLHGWPAPVAAFRLGRVFRHFGHAAAPKFTESKIEGGEIKGAYDRTTTYLRHVRANHDCTLTSSSVPLPTDQLPIDQEIHDLMVGSHVVIQTLVRENATATPHPLTVFKTIQQARVATQGFGSFNGSTTLLKLDSSLLQHQGIFDAQSDIRDYQIFEVTSPPIELLRPARFSRARYITGANALNFFGRLAEVQAVAGRRLIFQSADGRSVELVSTSAVTDFTLPTGEVDDPRMWPVSFDRPPRPFRRADFDEVTPTVSVMGNIVDATQGKAEGQVPLGNGDARARFQTFKIPKSPLTYLLSAGATPPHVPQLIVRVAGQAWSRVGAFYGHGPAEQIFIVREDGDGSSYVQFGDGLTGARLPSGVGNVTAEYRSGSSARGPVKPGADPSAGRRLEGLDKVHMPGVVSGGADPESSDKAREAAPGKVQSLGRLVSLRDFETETLSIPGVTAASAAWGLVHGSPTLTLRVLLEAGREKEWDAVRATIQHYQRCRGPDRFTVHVQQAFLRYVFLDLLYAADPRLNKTDVEAWIRAALGLVGNDATAGTGLFGLRARRLGAAEFQTRIEGVVQQVRGVTWCKVTAIGLFAPNATHPEALTLPSPPRLMHAAVVPENAELLQLHQNHLTLTSVAVPPAECA